MFKDSVLKHVSLKSTILNTITVNLSYNKFLDPSHEHSQKDIALHQTNNLNVSELQKITIYNYSLSIKNVLKLFIIH